MFDTLQQWYALHLAHQMYKRRFSSYGCSPKGVLWRNTYRQQIRYALIMKGVNDHSINDFGCGYGGLVGYLEEKGYQGEYMGYDMNQEMIRSAQKQYPSGSFYCSKHVYHRADFTLISGTLNLKMHASADIWWRFVQKKLKDCWEYSKIGMNFNLLEDTGHEQSPLLFYCNADTVFSFCKQSFGSRVEMSRHEEIGDLHFYIRR